MNLIEETIHTLKNSNCAGDDTFFQSVREVLESIQPVIEAEKQYTEHSIIPRLVIPDRQIQFKVTWFDDNNIIHVNNGYRVQYNNVLGPYKGGLRFHPSVNIGILKFLAFEQIFKNALTELPIGGGKGGSDFDPKGKSDYEIMRFCKAFMSELQKYIGDRIDVPAGDIGVGSREIGYLYGTYKQITSKYVGVLTGKPYASGGSLMRPEATGYGVIYFAKKMLELENKDSLEGKKCVISGSGNVAIHTIEKLYHLGAIPISCSDSKGTIYDKNGIDLDLLKKIKLVNRASLEEYKKVHTSCEYVKSKDYQDNTNFVWSIPCYAAFPCATQNELNENDAKNLLNNGCKLVAEGANLPCTADAIEIFQKEKNILFAPAKAANAGGVAVSEFEMSQNASMSRWIFEKVDKKLQETMNQICIQCNSTAKDYGVDGNYLDGANIAGFKKVADAMIAEGI